MKSISKMMKFQNDPFENEMTEKEIFEKRKVINEYWSKSRKDSKLSECIYCSEKCTSFCNSHTVPAFTLRNISSDGEVLNFNTLIDNPYSNKSDGFKRSGTFQLICRKCDSLIFSEYENPESYKDIPSGKMITQIAMKNYLRNIYKRRIEIELYKRLLEEHPELPSIERQLYISILDYKSYYRGFERAKKYLSKNDLDKYYMFYNKKLNYVVPYACQNTFALISDLEGKMINDIYYLSPKYEVQNIHIAILPFESSSEIILFVENNSKRYRRFYKQFSRLNETDKLALINYIVFNYTEDIYMSKKLKKNVLENDELIEIAKISNMLEVLDVNDNPYNIAKDSFDLSNRSNIPNLLMDEFSL